MLLDYPNNILAIEYLKTIKKFSLSVTPVAITRCGTPHDNDQVEEGAFASASFIRAQIGSCRLEKLREYLPQNSFEILTEEINAGRAPVKIESAYSSILSHLRRLEAEDLLKMPDISEGLEHRFLKFCKSACTVEEFYSNVKTKRYTLSRIRRLLLYAYLGITEEMASTEPPYLKVLAFNDVGRTLLNQMKKQAALPMIMKPASVKLLSENAVKLFKLEALSTDLYTLCYPDNKNAAGGSEWRNSPIYMKNEELT